MLALSMHHKWQHSKALLVVVLLYSLPMSFTVMETLGRRLCWVVTATVEKKMMTPPRDGWRDGSLPEGWERTMERTRLSMKRIGISSRQKFPFCEWPFVRFQILLWNRYDLSNQIELDWSDVSRKNRSWMWPKPKWSELSRADSNRIGPNVTVVWIGMNRPDPIIFGCVFLKRRY